MFRYYITAVEEDGIRYAESRFVWQIGKYGKEHCISKRRMAIGKGESDITARRDLWMNVDIVVPMPESEAVEEAQDRMLDLTESVGLRIVGWDDSKTEVLTS